MEIFLQIVLVFANTAATGPYGSINFYWENGKNFTEKNFRNPHNFIVSLEQKLHRMVAFTNTCSWQMQISIERNKFIAFTSLKDYRI